MIVGGYTLDLYCSNSACRHGKYGSEPAAETFFSEEGATCRRRARKRGWKFVRAEDGIGKDVLCPECAKA